MIESPILYLDQPEPGNYSSLADFQSLPSNARRCISLAVRDGRIDGVQDLPHLTDLQIRWNVRGRGQWNGIGTKTLRAVREVYPPVANQIMQLNLEL